jgi:hypothetical protein
MGLKQRLSDLFWPPDLGDEQSEPVSEEKPPAATSTAEPAGLGARLKRVGVSEEQRLHTRHQPAPVRAGADPQRARAGMSLKQRLQQVGVPDLDAKEVERQQHILDSSREAESRARRAAAYEVAAATCPVPIHPEPVPLPGDLRLREDEFLVAGSSRPAGSRDLTITTQRLIYSRGRNAEAQLVVYLADICDLVFHGETITVGTPSGRWQHLAVGGNLVVASRDRLLALVHHARAQRSALPGGLDEIVELRDGGAIGAAEYEKRRAAATAAPRRRRQRQVEVSGKPTDRHAPPVPPPAEAPGDAAVAVPAHPAEASAQPGDDEAR